MWLLKVAGCYDYIKNRFKEKEKEKRRE